MNKLFDTIKGFNYEITRLFKTKAKLFFNSVFDIAKCKLQILILTCIIYTIYIVYICVFNLHIS